jgi:hypothetical protein
VNLPLGFVAKAAESMLKATTVNAINECSKTIAVLLIEDKNLSIPLYDKVPGIRELFYKLKTIIT